MLHRVNPVAFCLLLLGGVRAHDHSHGDHAHGDHDHHDHHSHSHSNLRRNLGIFAPPGLCKDGDSTYTVGGVEYQCKADFDQRGGQCRTADKTAEQKQKFDEEFKAWKEKKEKENDRRRLQDGCGSAGCSGIDWDGGEVVTIPTYFHIVHAGTTGRKYTCDQHTVDGGTGSPFSNSDCSYIQDQIKVMNDGFRGVDNSLFGNQIQSPGVDTGIQFCIAGTTNTDNNSWYNDRRVRDMKTTLDVDGMETLNIFVTSAGGYLGYAYFATSSDSSNDGVVLLNDSMPNGIPGWVYSQGDTLTHEVGHHLNLDHTHAGGCGGPGDYMDDVAGGDTSNESTATYNCPVGLDNCSGDGGVNPIHNFMSYVDDYCMTQFTEGQKERMQATYEIYRYDPTSTVDYRLAADGFSCATGPTGPTTSSPTRNPVTAPPTRSPITPPPTTSPITPPPTVPPPPTPPGPSCEAQGTPCPNKSVNCCNGCTGGKPSNRVCR